MIRWVLPRYFVASKSSEIKRVCQLKNVPASMNDNISMKIVFRVITENLKSIIFGSTKHKAAIETAKCLALKVKF